MTANGSGHLIRVFDENGEQIGTTYPKRARGLVRRGRARWNAGTPNASEPVSQPDSIVIYRNQSGAEAEPAYDASQKHDHPEEDMTEFNNQNQNNNENRQPTEAEIRIRERIEKFRAEMAKAREIAEKAAAEAQAAMEEARRQSHGEENAESEAQKTVTETLKELGGKLNEAAESAAEGIREAVDEISRNESVRETAEGVKAVGKTVLDEAKKKLTEAEERLSEARRAYEEAEKNAEEAEGEAAKTEDTCDDLSKQVKENMKQLAEEAGDALRTAWGELKKGWKELSAASADSFEWLKENTKEARSTVRDAFREFGDSVRSMMSDIGDAGDAEEEPDENEEISSECDSGETDSRLNIDWEIPAEEDDGAEEEDDGEDAPVLTGSRLDIAQAEAMKTAGEIRADAARAARKSIEDEIESVKSRIQGMLDLVKAKYEEGSISFEQYMEYTDKYSEYLHTRLTELREELKNI